MSLSIVADFTTKIAEQHKCKINDHAPGKLPYNVKFRMLNSQIPTFYGVF